MWYVYIIRSVSSPEQEYIGATADLKRRMSDHNSGKSTHTAKFKPWELVWYCAFPDKERWNSRNISNPTQVGHLRRNASDASFLQRPPQQLADTGYDD
jgi:putative endonuclease